jgi:hypothetical protein
VRVLLPLAITALNVRSPLPTIVKFLPFPPVIAFPDPGLNASNPAVLPIVVGDPPGIETSPVKVLLLALFKIAPNPPRLRQQH